MPGLSRRALVGGAPAALLLGLCGCASPAVSTSPAPSSSTGPTGSSGTPASPSPSATPAFDRRARSIDDPASRWIVVDKRRPLQPKTYAPADLVSVDVPHTNPPLLRKAAAGAVVALFAAAKDDGVRLASNSTYRAYADQKRIYGTDRANLGRKQADRLTLRPGFSEHQTGLAIDIGTESGHCDLDECLGHRKEGRWLAKQAWRFGLVLRYPADKEKVTGIQYEPWHFRFVGESLAREMHETKLRTLEEFFDLPSSPSYV